jgi:hypothetical protein
VKRTGLGKKLRFEVFKRDKFTCQYCGRKSPDIVLQVDHVLPVSVGGQNIAENLVTSCVDCNAGKSDNPISLSEAPGPVATIGVVEKAEKLRELHLQMLKNKAEQDQWIEDLLHVWAVLSGEDEYCVRVDMLETVKTFLKQGLSHQQVSDAMQITFNKFSGNGSAKKYFCGVCWRKIKGDYEDVCKAVQ